jgi:hypothetical protein
MSFVQKVIGFAFAGMLAMTGWDGLVGNLGLIGGILAGLLIIFPMWLMNHYTNLTDQADDAAFVDMGLAIGVTGLARDFFMAGGDISVVTDAFPTLILVILGAATGGFVAAQIEKRRERGAE